MRKKLFFLLPLIILFSFTFISAISFSGLGDGSSGNPFQITNCTQLQEINVIPSAYYILMNNVDCSGLHEGTGFGTIGSSSTPFTGTFDGQGFIIDDLYSNLEVSDYWGLFGAIDGATISNVILTNVYIKGRDFTGGLVGYMTPSSHIENCSTSGTVYGRDKVGGLVGLHSASVGGGATIKYSSSSCDVFGEAYTGGLIGDNEEGTIEYSYATGDVTSTGTLVGGFVGANQYSGAIISNCYSTGSASSTITNYVGGFAGVNIGGAIINNSYSTGTATGVKFVGGFTGSNDTSVTIGFWDTETSGLSSSGGGIGKTTEEMKNINTYLDDGWTITASSNNLNDGYPYLVGDEWFIYVYEEPEQPISGSGAILKYDYLINGKEPALTITGDVVAEPKASFSLSTFFNNTWNWIKNLFTRK